jgi:hypothetical protein
MNLNFYKKAKGGPINSNNNHRNYEEDDIVHNLSSHSSEKSYGAIEDDLGLDILQAKAHQDSTSVCPDSAFSLKRRPQKTGAVKPGHL